MGHAILIRADGDHAIGLGHIYRMRTLAGFLAAQGHGVTFVSQPGTMGARLLADAGYAVFPAPGDGTYIGVDAVAHGRPDTVVLDLLDTDATALRALRAMLPDCRIVAVDDTGAGLALADHVINAMVHAWKRYDRGQVRAVLHEGPAYTILQDTVRAAIGRPRSPAAGRAERVLLAFGGTDTRGLTERALRALEGVPGPLRVRANLGPGSEPPPTLAKAAAASPHDVTLLYASPSLIAEMLDADLVICAGGTMLCELAALGIPAAAIAAEHHEALHIDQWVAAGSARSLGRWDTLDTAAVTAALRVLIDDGAGRQDMAGHGSRIMDGRGVERCAAIVAEGTA